MTGRTGRPVKNQWIHTMDNGDNVFQSYDSICAVCHRDGTVTIDPGPAFCSRTTVKYLRLVLGSRAYFAQEAHENGTDPGPNIRFEDLNGDRPYFRMYEGHSSPNCLPKATI